MLEGSSSRFVLRAFRVGIARPWTLRRARLRPWALFLRAVRPDGTLTAGVLGTLRGLRRRFRPPRIWPVAAQQDRQRHDQDEQTPHGDPRMSHDLSFPARRVAARVDTFILQLS